MNYSIYESQNRDTIPYSFQMMGEGLVSARPYAIDTTPRLVQDTQMNLRDTKSDCLWNALPCL
jgi:hypothetical protein